MYNEYVSKLWSEEISVVGLALCEDRMITFLSLHNANLRGDSRCGVGKILDIGHSNI